MYIYLYIYIKINKNHENKSNQKQTIKEMNIEDEFDTCIGNNLKSRCSYIYIYIVPSVPVRTILPRPDPE